MYGSELVKGVTRALQNIHDSIFGKNSQQRYLTAISILAKRLILDGFLGPACASTDWYITVLKIQTKICKDGRQVKMELIESTISIGLLSHKSATKRTIKSISTLPISKIFFRKFSANYYQSACGRVSF